MRLAGVSGGKAVLVGSNFKRLIAAEYDPQREPEFRLLEGAESNYWTRRQPVSIYKTGEGAEKQSWVYLNPKPFTPLRFGPGNRFILAEETETGTENPLTSLIVRERIGTKTRLRPLPKSTCPELRIARPELARKRYDRDFCADIEERIGPWQIADGTLWFGKAFPWGAVGIGGFGYLDAHSGKYALFSPVEIRDLSTSAILVETDSVWLGLVHRGEWDNGGGLLRFDRVTQKKDEFEVNEVVRGIARVGESLLLATDFGAAIIHQGKLRRFFVDETTGGRLRVVETIGGR